METCTVGHLGTRLGSSLPETKPLLKDEELENMDFGALMAGVIGMYHRKIAVGQVSVADALDFPEAIQAGSDIDCATDTDFTEQVSHSFPVFGKTKSYSPCPLPESMNMQSGVIDMANPEVSKVSKDTVFQNDSLDKLWETAGVRIIRDFVTVPEYEVNTADTAASGVSETVFLEIPEDVPGAKSRHQDVHPQTQDNGQTLVLNRSESDSGTNPKILDMARNPQPDAWKLSGDDSGDNRVSPEFRRSNCPTGDEESCPVGVEPLLHSPGYSEAMEVNGPSHVFSKNVEKFAEILAGKSYSNLPKSLELQLDPPSLGKVTVLLSSRGEEVVVKFITSSYETQKALSGCHEDLARALSERGLSLSGFLVDHGMKDQLTQPRHSLKRQTRIPKKSRELGGLQGIRAEKPLWGTVVLDSRIFDCRV